MKKYKKGSHEYTELGDGTKRVTKVKEKDNMTEEKVQNNNKVPIKIEEEVAMGKYVNLCMIAHTPEEFVLDFIYHPPGPPGTTAAKVVSRIITSPGHAKRLQMALNENIAKYELKHGQISPSPAPDNKVGFN